MSTETTVKKKGKTKLKAVEGEAPADSKRHVAKREVKVKLSNELRLAKTKEASHLQKELDEDEDLLAQKTNEFKEFKKPQDAKIKEKKGKIATILRELESGVTLSTEEVGVVFNYATNEVVTYFPKDSTKDSDVVERRTMDAKERQLSLLPEEAQAIAEGVPAEGQEAKE